MWRKLASCGEKSGNQTGDLPDLCPRVSTSGLVKLQSLYIKGTLKPMIFRASSHF